MNGERWKEDVARICGVGEGCVRFDDNLIAIWPGNESSNGEIKLELNSLEELFSLEGFEGKIEFKGCVFNGIISAHKMEVKYKIEFVECIFKRMVVFEGMVFEKNLTITGGEFSRGISSGGTVFTEGVDFHGVSFSGEVSFDGCHFGDETFFVSPLFENGVSFKNASFNHVLFKNAKFHSVAFHGCQFIANAVFRGVKFHGNSDFSSSWSTTRDEEDYDYRVSFSGCSFEKKVTFAHSSFRGGFRFQSTICKNGADFSGASFDDSKFDRTEFSSVSFQKSSFDSLASFREVMFKGDASFEDTSFEDCTYFDKSTFDKSAIFAKASFKKEVGFYGAYFKRLFDFRSTTFSAEMNFINVKMNFNFEDIENALDNLSPKDEKIKASNDYRESFRAIKNSLIKANNTLNATDYSKAELYCKELELKAKEPRVLTADWINKLRLSFYRHISDHHTDLLKIINWVLACIGCFGGILLCLKSAKHNNEALVALIVIISFYVCRFSVATNMVQCLKIKKHKTTVSKTLMLIDMAIVLVILALDPSYALGITSFKASAQDSGTVTMIHNLVASVYSVFLLLLLFSLQKTARRNSIVPN